jgi:hypothetical protein
MNPAARWLLALLLAAPLGGARAYCTCPEGAVVCGPTDLVLVADEQVDTINATDCEPDAAGHMEADIRISSNDALTSLELPPSLSSVGGYLAVSYNNALTSLELPPALRSLGVNLYVSDNPALTSLELPPALSSVGGGLWVSYNDALTTLDMRGLVEVGGDFTVTTNSPSITTTLACAVKHDAKFSPSGDKVYWNAYPTVCHSGAAKIGHDDTCNECSEYGNTGSACRGAAGACVRCNVTGPPDVAPGFVRFQADPRSAATEVSQVYPCTGSACTETAVCRCPFDQPTCDFATDLVNAQGRSGQRGCVHVDGSLGSAIYVYGNPTIETITCALSVESNRWDRSSSLTVPTCVTSLPPTQPQQGTSLWRAATTSKA